MKEVFAHPAQVPFWQAVEAGGPVVWDEVFAGYRSQVDLPGAHVWRELAEAYPQAKVVLTVRPEGSWWTSFSSTIGSLLSRPEPATLPPHVKAMLHVGATFIEDQTFGCPPTDKEGVLKAYRRRVEEVRVTIPADRLLVFAVTEGWTPLCRFLGVPVPAVPFPRANNTEQFWEVVNGPPAEATRATAPAALPAAAAHVVSAG